MKVFELIIWVQMRSFIIHNNEVCNYPNYLTLMSFFCTFLRTVIIQFSIFLLIKSKIAANRDRIIIEKNVGF